MSHYTVGVDVGGTNIKLGLVNQLGVIVCKSSLITKSFHKSKAKLINALVDEIKILISSKKLTSKNILGIGIGFPGLIDSVLEF